MNHSIVATIYANSVDHASSLCNMINTHEHCFVVPTTKAFTSGQFYIVCNVNNNLCKNVLASLLKHPMIGKEFKLVGDLW